MRLCSFMICAGLLGCSNVSRAGTLTLAWDPNGEPDLAGYRLYYGTASGQYDHVIDVANATTNTVTDLAAGRTYYFVATAYNLAGLESDPSNEVAHTLPNPPPAAATLLTFAAVWAGPGHVLATWQTGVESTVLGYRLERRLATGDWLFVSPRIIPAQDDGRPNDYRFEETGVPPAVSLRYRLSAVDLHGQTTVLAETAVQPGLHLDLDVRPDGVTVALHGVEGAPATLEMTADLAHGPWTTLGTIEFGPLGVGIATLPTPPTEPNRFFRARFAPP